MSENPASATASRGDRLAWVIILALTCAVLALVVFLRIVPRPDVMPDWAAGLPKLNASINSTCTLLLAASWFAIRRGRPGLHRGLNLAAFGLSVAFLASYVLFHAVARPTLYPAASALRPLYLTILLSHMILAVAVLPLVLRSFWLALTHRMAAHRRLARWAMPVWLYVTITGVVVYLMISPHYPF